MPDYLKKRKTYEYKPQSQQHIRDAANTGKKTIKSNLKYMKKGGRVRNVFIEQYD